MQPNTDNTLFADLRRALAQLYSDTKSVRRVVDDAGLNAGPIDFDSSIDNVWHSILTEARKEGIEKVKALCEIAQQEYLEDLEFARAYEAFLKSIGQGSKRIFISYKRDTDPDESVAKELYQTLSSQHEVFLDKIMLVGTRWAERIEDEIQQTDYLIVLLSADSVGSEMLQEEISRAHNLAVERGNGKPIILPVRLNYREKFNYPIDTYLDPINWAFWQGPEDTQRLIEELKQAISGGVLPVGEDEKLRILQERKLLRYAKPYASAQPDLESAKGTIRLESAFYIERSEDRIALETIRRPGGTIVIKAPRQMGKSSLLIRMVRAAIKENKRVAFLDFQLLDHKTMANADTFYRAFCILLTSELKLGNRVDDWWSQSLPNPWNCTKYLKEYLLKDLDAPLVIAIDETEHIFDTEFGADFFAMLRVWHNTRFEPAMKQLGLALVTSTEPDLFIDQLDTRSPFNVGETIELTDFTDAQIAVLNRRHGSPLTRSELQQLSVLLGGHPYLVRQALYHITLQHISATELFSKAAEDRGPFGDHLRHYLFLLQGKPKLARGLLDVIRLQRCEDQHIFYRLRGAGLVRQEGRIIVPRCQLYASFFKERLHV